MLQMWLHRAYKVTKCKVKVEPGEKEKNVSYVILAPNLGSKSLEELISLKVALVYDCFRNDLKEVFCRSKSYKIIDYLNCFIKIS